MTTQNSGYIWSGGGILRAFWKDTLLLLFSRTARSWQAWWGKNRGFRVMGSAFKLGAPTTWLGAQCLHSLRVTFFFTGKHDSVLFLRHGHSMTGTCLGHVSSVAYLSALVERGTVTSETCDKKRAAVTSEPQVSAITVTKIQLLVCCVQLIVGWLRPCRVSTLCPETEAEPWYCRVRLGCSTRMLCMQVWLPSSGQTSSPELASVGCRLRPVALQTLS